MKFIPFLTDITKDVEEIYVKNSLTIWVKLINETLEQQCIPNNQTASQFINKVIEFSNQNEDFGYDATFKNIEIRRNKDYKHCTPIGMIGKVHKYKITERNKDFDAFVHALMYRDSDLYYDEFHHQGCTRTENSSFKYSIGWLPSLYNIIELYIKHQDPVIS